jgi:hypothetical protein
MPLPSAITDPIALSAYALSLVFGAAGATRGTKGGSRAKWQMGAAYGLALVCIGGGLVLGFHRDAVKIEQDRSKATSPPVPVQPSSVMIEENQQTACNGSNVINVLGTVTTNGTAAGQGQTTNCIQAAPLIGPKKTPLPIPAPAATGAEGHTK